MSDQQNWVRPEEADSCDLRGPWAMRDADQEISLLALFSRLWEKRRERMMYRAAGGEYLEL
eukprot:scaffold22196_cov173-Skeletonema_marinoi.AAC.1